MKITPIKDRLILHPSDSSMRGGIFIPERYKDASTSCMVLAKGDKVSPHIKVGDVVLCQVGFGDRKTNTVGASRSFWCRQHNVYAVIKKVKENNIIYPIGKNILVRRDIEDKVLESAIVIPKIRRSQELDATIVRMGLTRENFRTNGLRLGLKVRLKEWAENMIEVTLEDGGYGLIVLESDLLFYYEQD